MKKLWPLLLVLPLFAPLSACDDLYVCYTGEMRCSGDQIEVCNADHYWVVWLDCDYGHSCYSDSDHCGGDGDYACCD